MNRRPSCASSSTARAHDMTPNNSSDSDMRDGARYQVRIKIKAAGTHSYSFVAQDSKGRETSLAGGTDQGRAQAEAASRSRNRPPSRHPSRPRRADRAARDSTAEAERPRRPRARGQIAAAAVAGCLPRLRRRAGIRWARVAAAASPGASRSARCPLAGVERPPATGRPGAGRRRIGSSAARQASPASASIAALTAALPGFGSDEWLTIAARSAVVATGSAAVVAMALFTFKRRRREDEDPYDLPTRDDALDEPPTARRRTRGRPRPH